MGSAIGYGTALTLTDTSSKIKKGTRGDATALAPTVMTAVPAILDRVRDGVRKKVCHFCCTTSFDEVDRLKNVLRVTYKKI